MVVDASSNYIDAIECQNRTVHTVKRCLSRLFGFFGLPKTVVFDNAPEFIALKEWLMGIGVRLIHTPPYNPASNGQAERAVRTIKEALKGYDVKLGDKFIFLQKVLLNHRTCSGKIAQAERILSFIPRTYVNKQF